MQTSVSPKHQATIPKKICDVLSIRAGSKIDWEVDYEKRAIVGVPIQEEREITSAQAIEELCGILKDTNILEEFLEEKHREIEEEKRNLKKWMKHNPKQK